MRRPALALPLLGKELLELAARPRTYVARVLYALLLYGGFAYFYLEATRFLAPADIFGVGHSLLQRLFGLQIAGILLFLPPMMCAAITAEKERGTLELLLLTDLSPRELIVQKYLSRLIPMATFLLLGLPLMGVAYTFGGVDAGTLRHLVLILALTCLYVGAFALLCSAYSQTPLEALIRCYVLGPLLSLPAWALVGASWAGRTRWVSFIPIGVILFLVVLFLRLAVWYLQTRLHVARRSFLGRQFQAMRRFGGETRRILRKLFQARADDTGLLPGEARVLLDMLFRRLPVPTLLGFVIIGGWIGFLGMFMELIFDAGNQADAAEFFVHALWLLTALLVPVTAVNALTSERTNQTLDVLLTTPLTGAEILEQKAEWARQLGRLLACLFALVFVLEALTENLGHGWWGVGRAAAQLAAATATVAVYLPLLRWLALFIGLRVRRQVRAVVGTLGVIGLVIWGPDALDFFGSGRLSPYAWIALVEQGTDAPVELLAWSALYGGGFWFVTRVLRSYCLRQADRLLGRTAGDAA